MTNPKVVIVTGANRGIGRAICQLILAKLNISPVKLFATSRSGADLGFASDTNDAGREIVYPKLDISSRDSIRAFAKEVEQHGTGSVDVLINNAGVNLDAEYGYENARKTLEVNYRGTLEMCRTFIPLLSKDGRIVNLSSVASSLKPYSETIQQRFHNSDATLEDLDKLAEEYLTSVRTSTEVNAGFGPPQRSYSVSKGLVNALTALLARDNPGLIINAACPGWINSDMGRIVGSGKIQPPKTAEEGAVIPLRLGFEDIGKLTGRFWANGSIRSKGDGEVQEW